MSHIDLVKRDPTLGERFREAVVEDPYRRPGFLEQQFIDACPTRTVEIEGQEYRIKEIEEINPKRTETTDLVLKLGTEEGPVLFAKADVSEDFIYHPDEQEITRVYGARSQREMWGHELQRRVGQASIAATRIGQDKNIWMVSEKAAGPRIGEYKVQEIVQADVKKYCYELGRMLAFSYMFGISDGHNQNTHYDGERVTQRDLESPCSDLIQLHFPIFTESRQKVQPARLFVVSLGHYSVLEDESENSAWKEIIRASLEDHLWPIRGNEEVNQRIAIGEGFEACFRDIQKAGIIEFVYEKLSEWMLDTSFYLEMQGIGLFPLGIDYPIEYRKVLRNKLRTDNPWRIFNPIWCDISPERVKAVQNNLIY